MNIEEHPEEVEREEKICSQLPPVWREFFDLKRKINSLPNITFKEVIQNTITDEEIDKLCRDFKRDFSKYPKNDTLYLEVVKLLLDMGIVLYEDEGDEEYKEKQEFVKNTLADCYNNIDTDNLVFVDKN